MDDLAEECIIEIRTESESIVKLLGSPYDLLDLAYGHIYSEGRGEIQSANIHGTTIIAEGNLIPRPKEDILTAACGACSTGDLAIPMNIVTNKSIISGRFDKIMNNMLENQIVFKETGGVHAAAILDENGKILYLREDVGRHNAMDKAIGACIRSGNSPGIICLTSRIGWELVAKAVRSNIGIIIAAGAISNAAEELARKSNVTLVGFANRKKPMIIGSTSRIVDKQN